MPFGMGVYSNVLGVWRAESQEWTQNFPEMPIARSLCSAVVYNEWLVVAGGYRFRFGRLSSVEVMNTDGLLDLQHQHRGIT